jgi:hypothetical protein
MIENKTMLTENGTKVPFQIQIGGDCPNNGFHKVINKMRDRIEWVSPKSVAEEAQRRIDEAAACAFADMAGD